ncbi:MAG: hypothetical protein ABSC51_04865 [Gaiellaceae bacterium]|jgi:MFS family permease
MRVRERIGRGELVALGAIVAASIIARLILAHETVTMMLVPDEYIYSEIARSLALYGSVSVRGTSAGFPALFYPILISPFWGSFDVETAYRLSQALNVIFASLAALPAFFLSRRLGFRPLLRLSIAALAVVIPGLAYASYVMADSLAYLLALSAIAVGARVLAQPSSRGELAFIALAGLAAFSRIQYLFLLPIFPLAALLLEPRRPLRAVRRMRLTFALAAAAAVLTLTLGLGSVLGYYNGVLDFSFHPLDIVRWIGSDAYVLVFAAGVFVVPGALIGVVLALAKPRRVEERALALLAVMSAAALLIEAGFYATNGSNRVQERYLLLLLPLVAVLFGIAVEHGRNIWRPTAAISAGLFLIMLAYPLTNYDSPTQVQDSPTLVATLQLQQWLGSGNAPFVVANIALVLLALAVLASARPRLTLPLGLALCVAFLGAGTAIAGKRFHDDSVYVADTYLPHDKSAVDRLQLGRVSFLRTPLSSRTQTVELMFWNRSIRELNGVGNTWGVDAYGFTPATIDRSGRLLVAGVPPRRPVVVDYYGTQSDLLGGRRLLTEAMFQVWKPDPELRFGFMAQGLYFDGWLASSGDAIVWPDASGWTRGVLHIELDGPGGDTRIKLSFSGSGRSFTVLLSGTGKRRITIPLSLHGHGELKFRSNMVRVLSDGRLTSVRGRIWFDRARSMSTNVARAQNR